jgi:hypothetical protein
MSCLQSFTLVTNFNTAVSVGPNLDIWGVSPRISWAYQRLSTGSTFNIQGFKNINVHGITIVGNMFTSPLGTGNSIAVDDWIFYVQISGQVPLIGGNITATPNDFNISYPGSNPLISLSKYNTTINFADPITSVQNIKLIDVRASGESAQSLTSINLGWYGSFVVYYSYQDED